MTLRPALARFERGFRRMGAWALDPLQRRRRVTEGQEVTAQETRTMLGLMAQANSAGAAMTDEQRLMMIQAAPGMRAREAVLLSIPNRSSVEENELHMIRREMAALEGRAQMQPRVRAFAAIPAVAGGLLGGVRLWMVFGAAAVGALAIWQIDSARLRFDRDKACASDEVTAGADTTRRPCIELGDTQRQLEHSRAALAEAARMVREADTNAMRTAETLRALERQRQIREQQIRRSQRDTQNILSGVGDPPDLGVRDGGPNLSDRANGDGGNANPR